MDKCVVLTLMWTQCTPLAKKFYFKANNFVPLCPRNRSGSSTPLLVEMLNPLCVDLSAINCDNIKGSTFVSFSADNDEPNHVISDFNSEVRGDGVYSVISHRSYVSELDVKQDSPFDTCIEDTSGQRTINKTDIHDTATTLFNNCGVNKTVEESAPNYANGGTILPHGKFLEINEVLHQLTHSSPLPAIPSGRKENILFILQNVKNNERWKEGKCSQFIDDCGAWNTKGTSPRTIYRRQHDGRVLQVVHRNGQYCLMRRVSGSKTPVSISPQSEEDDIFHVRCHYVTLKSSAGYKKRVTWDSDTDRLTGQVACVEYVGRWPGLVPHGNSPTNQQPHIRTSEPVMEKIRDKVKSDQLVREESQSSAPKSLKQVKNVKYNLMRGARANPQSHRGNFVDQVQAVMNSLHNQNQPFVQEINMSRDKAPTITCFTEEQINDIRRFCCSSPLGESTVLGMDKTFNFGNVHVTTTVYKNLEVKRRSTCEHPLMIGPLFLHGNSDQQTYNVFFKRLATELHGTPFQPVISSDEEKALTNAIQQAFPDEHQLVCTRHLKNNLKAFLADKAGVPLPERKQIVSNIFLGGWGISRRR